MSTAIITDPFCPHRGGKTKMTTGSGSSKVLASGELFVEYPDAGVGKGKSKIKIGDGVTAYSSLPYALGDTSTDPITFTASSATTVTAALNEAASGATLATIVAGLKKAISNLDRDVDIDINDINDALTASNNTPFRFGYDSATQKYGYILNQGGADTVIPFKGDTIHTETYTANTRGPALDMGEIHSYRYVDTNSVPNENTETYTFPADDTGDTKDLGVSNTYRYVNATNVYNTGKAGIDDIYNALVAKGITPASTSSADIVAAIDTIVVPSGTYTYPSGSTGGTVNVTNYAQVNASNVYAKGKADGDVKHTISIYANGHSGDWNSIIIKEGGTELARGSCSSNRAYNITI